MQNWLKAYSKIYDMKKYLLSFLLTVLTVSLVRAQGFSIVFDYRMVESITANHEVTLSLLRPINGDLDKIRGHRESISKKIAVIQGIQQLMYDGHFRVAHRVSKGTHVVYIRKIINDIAKFQRQMVTYAKENPKLLLVAYQGESALVTRTLHLFSYVHDNALKGGDNNLISAKQRMQLIRYVIKELRIMRGLAYGVARKMRLAKRVGIIKAIDPFRLSYPNRDLAIIKDILDRL